MGKGGKANPVVDPLLQVQVQSRTHFLEDGGVSLQVMVVSSVNFGDKLDRRSAIDPLKAYVSGVCSGRKQPLAHCPTALLHSYCDAQYETYLQEELKTVRDLVNFHDTRIHVCLYFFTPTGTKVKPSDIACLKKIHKLVCFKDRERVETHSTSMIRTHPLNFVLCVLVVLGQVNVVPVIAKADTITKEELVRFKEVVRSGAGVAFSLSLTPSIPILANSRQLLEEFDKNEIEIYHPDEEGIEAEYEQYIPFSVIGSREEIVVNGEKLRVRQYPWGLVEGRVGKGGYDNRSFLSLSCGRPCCRS